MNAAKSEGKGLSWNDKELVALAQAAPEVCEDLVVGNNTSRRDIGRLLKRKMAASDLRPSDARTLQGSEEKRDDRRWAGAKSHEA